MSGIVQDNRLLQVETTLGADALIATQLTGSESLSHNFRFQLTAFSQADSNDLNELIGTKLTVTINYAEQALTFNAIACQVEATNSHYKGQPEYLISLVPWSEQLTIGSNCQVFQNQSVVDIFTALCKAANCNDFETSKLSQTYPKLAYVVQYNESSWQFLNRILADAGIFYYFVHSQDQHILTLADQSATLPNLGLVGFRSAQTEDSMTAWQPHDSLGSNKLTQNAYNYSTPNTDLTSSANQTQAQPIAGNTTLEAYQFPGDFQDKATAADLLKQQLAIQNWQKNLIAGDSTVNTLVTGKRFNFKNSFFVLVSVEHSAHDHSHLTQQQGQAAYSYQNRFTCIPASLPYYPPLLPAPKMDGIQSAQVTCLDAVPIASQQYAEVRVKFPWERDYVDAPNQYWLRVAQQTAGSMGAQFLPRNGNEVLTAYHYNRSGDPVVLGSSYNDLNLPPFPLPAQQAQSGIRTQSVASQGYNQLSFTDIPGQELLYIFAQNSLNTNVNNNETAAIQNNLTLNISGDHNTYLNQGKSTFYSPNQVTIAAGQGKITITPSSLTLEGSLISLGMPGSPIAIPPAPIFSPGTPVSITQTTLSKPKTEIVYLLDYDGVPPPSLKLTVNSQNPLSVVSGAPFTYPLTDQQQSGAMSLAYQVGTGTLQSTMHCDIGGIAMQTDNAS